MELMNARLLASCGLLEDVGPLCAPLLSPEAPFVDCLFLLCLCGVLLIPFLSLERPDGGCLLFPWLGSRFLPLFPTELDFGEFMPSFWPN